jgi:hypothetical protein
MRRSSANSTKDDTATALRVRDSLSWRMNVDSHKTQGRFEPCHERKSNGSGNGFEISSEIREISDEFAAGKARLWPPTFAFEN